MSTITFTQTDNGSAVVTITGKIVYGTDFYYKRLNHFRLDIVDGSEKVYDSGPTKIYGILLMKDISITDKNNFLSWLRLNVILDKNRFTISAIANLNLGKGINTAVTNCRFNGGNETKDVLEFMPPGKYNMTLKYTALV